MALNPFKRTGIVIVGAIGKVGEAIKLLQFYLSGVCSDKNQSHAFQIPLLIFHVPKTYCACTIDLYGVSI